MRAAAQAAACVQVLTSSHYRRHSVLALRSSGMRVLVTGGAGFIGSHVVDALLARGDDVAVLDDLASGRTGRLDPQVAVHKLSIADAPALTDVVTGFAPELICHLAAQIDVRA